VFPPAEASKGGGRMQGFGTRLLMAAGPPFGVRVWVYALPVEVVLLRVAVWLR